MKAGLAKSSVFGKDSSESKLDMFRGLSRNGFFLRIAIVTVLQYKYNKSLVIQNLEIISCKRLRFLKENCPKDFRNVHGIYSQSLGNY